MTTAAAPNSPLRRVVGIFGRRLCQAAFVAWTAYTLTWIILYWLPGDALSLLLGPDAHLTAEEQAKLTAQYGFDRPVWERYLSALFSALQLDFGTSLVTGQPVITSMRAALPVTALLSVAALAMSVVLGLGLALLSTDALRAPAPLKWLSRLPAMMVALPTFVVGLLLLQFFAFKLRWLPATGSADWRSIILPAVTLAIPGAGLLAQLVGRNLRDTLNETFIRMMRARGYSEIRILRHALRAAALPALTMAGLIVGGTLASAVVTETVFSRQGLGRLMQMGVMNKDTDLVCGLITFSALTYVLISLLVDLIHPLLDPRAARA